MPAEPRPSVSRAIHPSPPRRRAGELAPPVRRAADLLGDSGVLHIEHEGAVYTLRLTRNGRLILYK